MKTLTIRQPWASLVALGVKTIETRSWSTKYRGPLAIHAGKHLIDNDEYYLWHRALDKNGITNALDRWAYGAVVSTCELVDVVPIIEFPSHIPYDVSIWIEVDGPRLTLQETLGHFTDISDQLPYGDFSPGRFAWILSDIKPLAVPIPAKGKQGLWELEMEVA